MTGEKQRRTVKDYLDSLVDEQGLRSDISVTVTPKTAWTVLGVGCGIIVCAVLISKAFPNKQLVLNNQLLAENNRLLAHKSGAGHNY